MDRFFGRGAQRCSAAACGAALRCLSARTAGCLLVLVLAGVMWIGPGSVRLAAQEDDEPGSQDVALLTDGPELARGLPFLPANVIQHYRGRYEYLHKEIDIFYTEKEMLRFSSWQPVDCEGYRLYRLAGAPNAAGSADTGRAEDSRQEDSQQEGSRPTLGEPDAAKPVVRRPVFFYQTDQYALFIRVEQQYLCTFFPRFMSKFIYFRSVQDFVANRPPFPAVVD